MKAPLEPADIASKVQDARQGVQTAFAWLHRTFAPLVYAIHKSTKTRLIFLFFNPKLCSIFFASRCRRELQMWILLFNFAKIQNE